MDHDLWWNCFALMLLFLRWLLGFKVIFCASMQFAVFYCALICFAQYFWDFPISFTLCPWRARDTFLVFSILSPFLFILLWPCFTNISCKMVFSDCFLQGQVLEKTQSFFFICWGLALRDSWACWSCNSVFHLQWFVLFQWCT